MSTSENLNLDPLVGAYSDDFAYLASGSTPETVMEKYVATIVNENRDTIQQFNAVCLVSAAANKRAVIDYLARVDHRESARFILAHWSLRNEVNNTALNMVGHLLLCCANLSQSRLAMAYRKRLNGNSIWSADINASRLSEAQKRIIKEKISTITHAQAKAAGDVIVRTAVETILKGTRTEGEAAEDFDARKRRRVEEALASPVITQIPVPMSTDAAGSSRARMTIGLDALPDTLQGLALEYSNILKESTRMSADARATAFARLLSIRNELKVAAAGHFGCVVDIEFPDA